LLNYWHCVKISAVKKVYSEEEVFEQNPLVLAYVGDAVMTLYVREHMALSGFKVNKLNKLVSGIINAGKQAEIFLRIESTLNEREMDVARRARNTNMHHMAKNYSVMDYRYATSLEAVIGYLYLTNNQSRLNKILGECV